TGKRRYGKISGSGHGQSLISRDEMGNIRIFAGMPLVSAAQTGTKLEKEPGSLNSRAKNGIKRPTGKKPITTILWGWIWIWTALKQRPLWKPGANGIWTLCIWTDFAWMR